MFCGSYALFYIVAPCDCGNVNTVLALCLWHWPSLLKAVHASSFAHVSLPIYICTFSHPG